METLLRRGLRELGLPEDAAPAMARHAALLMERNQVMNLTALRTDEEIARLHFLDSAAVARQFDFAGKSLADVGSGGGFPGLPLRVLEPSMALALVEAQKKRADFLRETAESLALDRTECLCARAEALARTERRESFDAVISRAVAALPVLAELCLPLVRPGGHFLAMKSIHCGEELDAASGAIRLLGGEVEQVRDYGIPGTDARRRLVVIRKTRPAPPAYPRPFAKMKRTPLRG